MLKQMMMTLVMKYHSRRIYVSRNNYNVMDSRDGGMKVKARQRDVYYFIKHFIAAYKASPTYKEICAGCRIKSKSHAYSLVSHLIDEGYIEKDKDVNLNRQLKLTKKRYRIMV